MIPGVAAIIPAHNEEKTIANLVYILKRSELFSEVIVVSDGSTDRTVYLARRAGAKVIVLPENIGKGGALSVGVTATETSLLLFMDADLSGIKREHLRQLINPLLKNGADMVVGIQPKWEEMYNLNHNIPVLSGQRALKREIFEQVPEKLRKGYQIEEALNYYCKMNNQRIKLIPLEGISHLQKLGKRNFFVGIGGYMKMGWQIAKIFIIVRIIRLIRFLKLWPSL